MVNADNYIIVNAYRSIIEPIFGRWISPMQEGFLKGRSIIKNVVGLTHVTQGVALNSDRGGLLLDSKAAFPSFSHGYFRAMLRALGIPGRNLHMVHNLYDDHKCNLALGGEIHSGFEILLRRSQRRIPGATIRAFADDIVLVVSDVAAALPILVNVFLNSRSSLAWHSICPNMSLSRCGPAVLIRSMPKLLPTFLGGPASLLFKGEGYVIGTEVADICWDRPKSFFVAERAKLGPCWFGFTICDCCVYHSCSSQVVFCGSVAPTSGEVIETESKACRVLILGPYNRILKEDLLNISRHCGQQRSVPSLVHLCCSAQKRVYAFENFAHGGLHVRNEQSDLEDWIRNSGLFVLVLLRGIIALLRGPSPLFTIIRSAWTPLVSPRLGSVIWLLVSAIRRKTTVIESAIFVKFQCTVHSELDRMEPCDPIARIGHKVARCNLSNWPSSTTRHIIRVLALLKKAVAATVSAAFLRTLWNGRLRSTASVFVADAYLYFRIGLMTDSSIMPFVHGSVALAGTIWMSTLLRWTFREGGFITLGLNAGVVADDTIVRSVVWVYAAYHAC